MTVCGIKHADGVCVMGECPHIKKCCPVVWDKSGEPMTKEIKIRCDDCKFVEDCVDYGWQDCRKFTQKPSEPMTNEEYLRSCNTEQLAEFLLKIGEIDEAPIPCGDLMECSKNCGLYSQCAGDDVMPTNKEIWLEWLKQPHTKGDSE